jgi:hypothetical protein
LLKYAVQGTRRQIIARFAGNGHSPSFGSVLELPMTSSRDHDRPTIPLQSLQDIANFHAEVRL